MIIGVFDSGVGGLTVYKELRGAIPDADFIYLGDTARVPYGIRSPETIRRYALENCLFLMERGAEMIVVACNTATALALPYLETVLKAPVIGVVKPGVEAALKATVNRKIGVIATEATIRSQVYERALTAMHPGVSCLALATPLFVPVVEEGMTESVVLKPLVAHYLKPFCSSGIDTLILGCTHYPLIRGAIAEYLGASVRLVDSARATALEVKSRVAGKSPSATRSRSGIPALFVTDAPERVTRIAGTILGEGTFRLEKVVL